MPIAALIALVLLPQAPASRPQSAPASTRPEARSLLGEPLHRLPMEREIEKAREARLEAALADLKRNPTADAYVWVARRLSWLGRFQEAVDRLTEGLARFPDDPALLRHRGHRYITTRKLDLAVADLERASKLAAGKPDVAEPNETPEQYPKPMSTLHYGIAYHLGLAHYLRGDFAAALAAFSDCRKLSDIPDKLVGAAHWQYMTLRRLKRDAEAKEVVASIGDNLEIFESHSYARCIRLYQGKATPEELVGAESRPRGVDLASIGYAVANWHLYNGRADAAMEGFREIVASAPWPAFGTIASEVELVRARGR